MESSTINLLWGALIVLIFVSAFFSGSEIGMMSLNRYRLRHMVRQKVSGAKRIQKLLARTDRLLGIILIGNTFANILASAITTIMAVHYFGEIGVAFASVVLTLIILIFSEMAPKTLAALYPFRFAFVVSLPLSILLRILYPLVWLANTAANGLLALFGISVNRKEMEHLSSEELRTLVHEAGERIPASHQEMLLSIFDLEKASVNDIMIPRHDVIGIDLTQPWNAILAQLQKSKHTRLPVYREELNNIEGILHMRDALNLMAKHALTKPELLRICETPYYIPENTPLNTQLINFRREKHRMALVVDEYGDVQGLVALEDILEEIVGEFTTSLVSEQRNLYSQADGSYLIPGAMPIREINKVMNWDLPIDGPKTLSGLIIEHLEFIPKAGTGLVIAGYSMEVMKVEDNQVKIAKIFPKLDVAEVSEPNDEGNDS